MNSISVTFNRAEGTESVYIYPIVLDTTGKIVYTNFAVMEFATYGNTGAFIYGSGIVNINYEPGYYMVLISGSADGSAFYVDNSFIFPLDFNLTSMTIVYQDTPVSTKIFSSLSNSTSSYITGPVTNITRYIVNTNVTSDNPCTNGSILVGDFRYNVASAYYPNHNICISNTLITDLKTYINDMLNPTNPDIPVNPNDPVVPVTPSDNINWITWIIIAVIVIIVLAGIIALIVMGVNKRKQSKQLPEKIPERMNKNIPKQLPREKMQ
jgi:hypothetical protein